LAQLLRNAKGVTILAVRFNFMLCVAMVAFALERFVNKTYKLFVEGWQLAQQFPALTVEA
jgi:hypothetical protein